MASIPEASGLQDRPVAAVIMDSRFTSSPMGQFLSPCGRRVLQVNTLSTTLKMPAHAADRAHRRDAAGAPDVSAEAACAWFHKVLPRKRPTRRRYPRRRPVMPRGVRAA